MDEEKKVIETTAQAPKKRGGRKPMTAEEKAAAAKARAVAKAKADSLKPVFVVQFQGSDEIGRASCRERVCQYV